MPRPPPNRCPVPLPARGACRGAPSAVPLLVGGTPQHARAWQLARAARRPRPRARAEHSTAFASRVVLAPAQRRFAEAHARDWSHSCLSRLPSCQAHSEGVHYASRARAGGRRDALGSLPRRVRFRARCIRSERPPHWPLMHCQSTKHNDGDLVRRPLPQEPAGLAPRPASSGQSHVHSSFST